MHGARSALPRSTCDGESASTATTLIMTATYMEPRGDPTPDMQLGKASAGDARSYPTDPGGCLDWCKTDPSPLLRSEDTMSARFAVRLASLPVLLLLAVQFPSSIGTAQITEIIDPTGDGAGNGLAMPYQVAVDGARNVYVVGYSSCNAFQITPTGTITEIIDITGDGAGNTLLGPPGIAVDTVGNVYVAGGDTDNALMITDPGLPTQTITEIIDLSGDGAGNQLTYPIDIAVDGLGSAYVVGYHTHNAFRITDPGLPTQTIVEIMDATADGVHGLGGPNGVIGDESGNAYVAGAYTHNAFKVTPGGVITQIIDATGDGLGNALNHSFDFALDGPDTLYLSGYHSANVFRITDPGLPSQTITEIIDTNGDGAGNRLTLAGGVAVDGLGSAYVVGGGTQNAFRIFGAPTASCAWYCGTGANTATDGYVITNPAVLGGSFSASVTGCATGNAGAFLAGFSTSWSFPSAWGELLVNIADPNGELLGLPSGFGEPALINVSVPSDSSLSGFVFYTQAASFFPICLHCAYECTVGV